MAGYAAALRVLTRYSVINGKDMIQEAIRPRIKGEKTFVDDLNPGDVRKKVNNSTRPVLIWFFDEISRATNASTHHI